MDIYTMIRKNMVYISDGHFIWSDGSSLNYLPWDDGQPSNTTSSEYNSGIHTYSSTREDCGEIKYTSGKLNDEKCSATNGYVCKTPQSKFLHYENLPMQYTEIYL